MLLSREFWEGKWWEEYIHHVCRGVGATPLGGPMSMIVHAIVTYPGQYASLYTIPC